MDTPRVLLVDDEASILKSISRLLRRESIEPVVTTSPDEALQLFSANGFAAVVSDQRMPGMEGTQLFEHCREIDPDVVRIMLTGYAEISTAAEAINRGAVYRFITKPWNDQELLATVREAISRYEMVKENKRLHELTQRQNAELTDLNENLEEKVRQRTHKITRLNQQLEESFIGSIQVMANLGEMHSPTIGSHAKRVAAYCKSMSRLQGMSDIETFQIEVAAVLHDIGKIGISSSILNKSESTMTRLDQEIYRKHVIHGEAILQMVPNVAEAPKYVRHHHERFDGNGYPDRLKGRDIPIGARMIAVVDAYDNVMNKRSFYQTATQEKALKYIRGRCPSQFDPDILKVFVECLEGAGSEAVREAEVEVNMRDITEGMVLSRDLRTAKGILILSADTRIKQNQLEKIRRFHEIDPIVDGLFVYRRARREERPPVAQAS